MTEKDVFLAICGINEDGDGKAITMIETLYASADTSKEDRTMESITFDGVPVNIFRSLRTTMVDLQFRDNTDYDYIQTMNLLKSFSKPENSLYDTKNGIPTLQLTIMPKELEGTYYLVGIHGMWCTMADEAGRLPDIIRFIFDNDLINTYSVSGEIQAPDIKEEIMEENDYVEG